MWKKFKEWRHFIVGTPYFYPVLCADMSCDCRHLVVTNNVACVLSCAAWFQIHISRKWGFTKWNRVDYEGMRLDGRLVPDGVNAQYRPPHGPLAAWKKAQWWWSNTINIACKIRAWIKWNEVQCVCLGTKLCNVWLIWQSAVKRLIIGGDLFGEIKISRLQIKTSQSLDIPRSRYVHYCDKETLNSQQTNLRYSSVFKSPK